MSETLRLGRVWVVLQVVLHIVKICQMQNILFWMHNSVSSLYNFNSALSDSFGERESTPDWVGSWLVLQVVLNTV